MSLPEKDEDGVEEEMVRTCLPFELNSSVEGISKLAHEAASAGLTRQKT